MALFGTIPKTLENYDERMLSEVGESDRISYSREFRKGENEPHHLVVVTVDEDKNINNWTHMTANEQYKERQRAKEREAIKRRGLITRSGKPVGLSYEEYLKKKKAALFYLGNKALSEHQRPQEPPPDLMRSVAENPAEVKGKSRML